MTETHITLTLSGTGGQVVRLTAGNLQSGVNVQLNYEGGITTFNPTYFADVLTALVLGETHVAGIPGYCGCKACREERGTAFAEKLAAAQALRLDIADRGFYFPTAGGHMFLACTDAPEICQRCNAHKGNHDGTT